MDKLLEFFNGDELAANVWENKYKFDNEKTPNDMFNRHTKEIGRLLLKRIKEYNNLTKNNENEHKLNDLSKFGKKYWDKLSLVITTQKEAEVYIKSILNFNNLVLGGSMMQGIGNHELYSSLSNCFVLGQPHDSYAGINKKEDEISQVMKRRGGTGLDLSTLRPEKAKIHNQAIFSDGPVLFAEGYSNKTLQVAQYGRRGALMLSLSIKHPDSLKFITAKQNLTKITGANISVKITDDFMEAVKNDTDYYLRFPVDVKDVYFEHYSDIPYNELIELPDNYNQKTYIKKIKAKEYWNTLIQCAWNTAEPGILFEGNWEKYGLDYGYEQYRPISTNPCFAYKTPLLTSEGYFNIGELENKQVQVWNGRLWSNVTIKETGQNQPMLKITTSDGGEFECTDYHTWLLWHGFNRDGYEYKKLAKNLQIGEKLIKFDLPVVEGGKNLEIDAYSQGFYVGDGRSDRNGCYLYGEKIKLGEYLKGSFGNSLDLKNYYDTDKKYFTFSDKMISKDFVPLHGYSVKTRLDWLAGLIDADGCHDEIGGCQIGSTNYDVIKKIRLLLNTLGVSPKINKLRNEGYRDLPDQKGGLVNVLCKAGYRILINGTDIQHLLKLGLITHRVNFTKFNPKRNAKRFITITNIERIENAEKVYCFTEPIANRAIFNGCLIGQCSEIPMQPYDACRLIARNLYTLVEKPFTDKSDINYDVIYDTFYVQLVIADILIDLDIEYINRIINKIKKDKIPQNLTEIELKDLKELKKSEIKLWEKIKETALSSRRTGCGFIGYADMMAALGLEYTSTLNVLFETKFIAELQSTIDLSILFGSFKGFNIKFEENSKLTELIHDEYLSEYIRMTKYGRRNVSWSTAAPTGTGAIMTQTTSGIEPLFKPFYKRRKRCITPQDKVDYIDPNDGQKFTEYYVLHPKFIEWYKINYDNLLSISKCKENLEKLSESKLTELFEKSPWYGQCAEDINYLDRLFVQAMVQKYTTHAISSTINLPKDVDPKVISDIYFKSWELGLKGNTVYRDGSRSGILINETKVEPIENITSDNEFYDNRAPKRPKVLPARYHTIKYRNKTYSIIIGLLQNKPYEIFIVSGINNLPENFDEIEDFIEGSIVKEYKDWYNFESDTFILKDIPDTEDEEKLLSMMLSGLLRHRTPLRFVIKILEKTKPIAGSFTHRLIKVLSLYLINGEKTGDLCPQCNEPLIHENGCVICKVCGWTEC